MSERTVRTDDGVALHTRLDGPADAPYLLTINSLGTDLTTWEAQVADWATTRRVLRYDQRGHGASSVPAGPYTIDRLGHDALAVLDAYGIERVDVCGLSLGGVVALWLGAHAPDRVSRLVLADTAARVGTEQGWRERAALVREQGMDAVVDLVLGRFFSPDFRRSGAPALDAVATALRDTRPEGYAASCEALATADLREVAGRVGAPALVLVGTADEATPPSDARALADRLPAATYVELPVAGHLANLEQPEAFSAQVADFLAATTSSSGDIHA
ncbi:3-oxoadipate enol-lactonase [Egicoccus halophilus]|uniref:3-oxoadipate enol-lactonase n=1 Tax=Egicoccus halophilus TaxID=1670830 RepID=A0A8J3A636_9ACTN|nr:3-oxoadipate enol-lactonase [Egicoccus halophilus]GGI04137.1 3-oxoadipate enol-lactonase [Egicoccus halophilus]